MLDPGKLDAFDLFCWHTDSDGNDIRLFLQPIDISWAQLECFLEDHGKQLHILKFLK